MADGRGERFDETTAFAFVHREIVVLVVLVALVVVGFLLTRAAAGANRAHRRRDAAVWYETGKQQLAAGQIEAAIAALRRAAAANRDNRAYRLALAAALAADRQDEAARQVLLGVRESTPEDSDVNFQLARLEARHDDLNRTIRYYQNAMYGTWGGDQGDDARRQVRIELIRYLLTHEQRGRALSELLLLTGNLPDDVASQTEAGQLFLEAREPRRALERFRQALRIDPTNTTAIAGAGEAAFEAGDYKTAHSYLSAVDSPSARISEIRAVTELVLTRDPLRPGLSLRERHDRVMAGLTRALEALDACVIEQPVASHTFEVLRAEAGALQPALAIEKLRRNPESIDGAVNLVDRIEQQTADSCGEGSVFDRALLLIGRRHERDQQ